MERDLGRFAGHYPTVNTRGRSHHWEQEVGRVWVWWSGRGGGGRSLPSTYPLGHPSFKKVLNVHWLGRNYLFFLVGSSDMSLFLLFFLFEVYLGFPTFY